MGTGRRGVYTGSDFGKTEIFFRSGLDKTETQTFADLPVGQIRGRCCASILKPDRLRRAFAMFACRTRALNLRKQPLTTTFSPRRAGRGRVFRSPPPA